MEGCGYAGRSTGNLAHHKKTHLKPKRTWKCQRGCTYEGRTRADLRRHHKGHRLLRAEEEEDETDESEEENRRRNVSRRQLPPLKITLDKIQFRKCRRQPCTFWTTEAKQLTCHECQAHPPQVQLSRMVLRFKIFDLDDGRSLLMSTSMIDV